MIDFQAKLITRIVSLVGLICWVMISSEATKTDKLLSLYHINNFQQWISEDCKEMTLADFTLDTVPEHLRNKAHKLAEMCLSKK
ncbi:hypothetical protein K9X45_002974 [Salmonella enterica]|uniref:Uncharacterized protein n=1 Tax=Salmonella enterica TaxID=28901 RepID=A0A3K5RF37_SALER|nr:hypothetical protein [Salmonella enterica]EBY3697883.1 hypothetical protein [Salmonella enterica subsp. enterica serovar Muenchen]ECH9520973.1 hypothetical protein [Salmonella enterica subsp. enterica]EDR9393720.1 hypothetical protein [Salmonella enterica subsp. enterica serovar Baildon]EEE1667019.1 hypothetical protein [Salmonella enterica subsp. houtenae serovar 48:z4,z32:-]